MAKLFDRVKVNIATTGTGTVTFGSASSNAFLTPTEAGCADGDTVRYVIVDGTDFEVGIGTIASSVATMERTTVTKSKIGGTAGTSKINLSGTAVLSLTAAAADIVNPANNLSDLADAATARTNLGGTTVGKALFTATDAVAARSATAAAPNDLSNISLAVSANAGALTIALKDGAGNDATATTPIVLDFRDPTGTTGTKTKLAITAAASLVLSSGSTLGVTSSKAFRLWVVGFNDGGTFRLGAVLCTDAVAGRFALVEDRPASSTAEGGAGGADSALTIYTGTAVTDKAFRVLGYIEWSASGLTAGTWTTTNVNYVQTFGPGVKLPGESIQRRWAFTATATSNATSTFADTNLQKAITPTSAANAVRAHVQGGILCPAAASRGAVQLRRGSGASGPQIGMVVEGYANSTTAIMPVDIDWIDYPNSASSVTYTAQVASQNNTGTVQFPQAPTSSSNVYGFIELEEIQS